MMCLPSQPCVCFVVPLGQHHQQWAQMPLCASAPTVQFAPVLPLESFVPRVKEAPSPSFKLPVLPQANLVQGGKPIQGQVWCLCQDSSGCREVQRALEDADADETRVAIAEELRGHIWNAVKCPHGNFVVQKCITVLRPHALQFIVDELAANPVKVAQHKYGCRIVQRLLEHCRSDQVEDLVGQILAHAARLSKHIYASYVLQHVAEHGTDSQQRSLCAAIIKEVVETCASPLGCNVVFSVLSHGEYEGQVALAGAILNECGLVPEMSLTRFGHTAVLRAIELANDVDRTRAIGQISANKCLLQTARYGRSVLRTLELEVSKPVAFLGGA